MRNREKREIKNRNNWRVPEAVQRHHGAMAQPSPAIAFYVNCLGSRQQPSEEDALYFLDHFDLFLSHCRKYRGYTDDQISALTQSADEVRRLMR